jgi:N-acetylmuramoyl-L-alanine amidase
MISQTWQGSIRDRWRWVVGGLVVLTLVGAALAMTLRRAQDNRDAQAASLTLTLPTAVTNRIYGAPGAKGRPIIVLDAGHGGRDPGATSVSGAFQEKQLTMALAAELRDLLVKRGRVRVAMTREQDAYLTLEERAALARRLGAGLFVSLHADSAPNPLARGASIYSLADVASDAEAARFAAAQNNGLAVGGSNASSVQELLADLAVRSEMTASADFASRLVGKSAGRFELRPQPHRFAAFHVLRRAGSPAVLFEAGYISNADDERLLSTPQHRTAIVLAMAQAIEADIATRNRR